mgnify:CR=1 FL=1
MSSRSEANSILPQSFSILTRSKRELPLATTKLPLAFRKLLTAKRLFPSAFNLFPLADSILSSDFRKLTLAKRKLKLASSILTLAVSILPLATTDKQTANRQFSPPISRAYAHTLRFRPHKATAPKAQRVCKPPHGFALHQTVIPSLPVWQDSDAMRIKWCPTNDRIGTAHNSGLAKCGVQSLIWSVVLLSYIWCGLTVLRYPIPHFSQPAKR